MEKREELNKKIRIATNICTMLSAHQETVWFLCFGTLLSFVRNNKFNIKQDIDIGIIGSINPIYDYATNTFSVDHIVKNDATGEILNFSYYDNFNKIYIDLFKWVKFKGMYWHTYDQDHERPENGILSKYVFRSMPEEVFLCPQKQRKGFIEDLRYNNMSPKGTWFKNLPDAPEEGIQFCLPYMYGYFLDVAYPDWHTTRTEFGQSEGYTKITVNSCKGLC